LVTGHWKTVSLLIGLLVSLFRVGRKWIYVIYIYVIRMAEKNPAKNVPTVIQIITPVVLSVVAVLILITKEAMIVWLLTTALVTMTLWIA
tara:strand:+ start:436 stop:705 length:270 start_codon:yes stop_codon:yes gene_type:complete